MAMSTQVKESLNLAASHLRDALAFSARSEHAVIVSSIADIISRIDSLDMIQNLVKNENTLKNAKLPDLNR
jgi:hypothetical protein